MTDARKTLNSWWDSLFLETRMESEVEADGFRDGGVDGDEWDEADEIDDNPEVE